MNRIDLLDEVPLVAIIRGVVPEKVLDVGEAVYAAGFRVIEVPLNSPSPFQSIRLLSEKWGDKMLVGAGTVLTKADVEAVSASGGQIIVSPNVNEEVIQKTKELGMVSYPGIMTVSEAFAALQAGADGLKLFPGDAVGAGFVKAAKAVLPQGTRILVVGGVNDNNLVSWLEAGADGFGLGSSIYKPEMSIDQISSRCRAIRAKYSEYIASRI